MGKYLCFLLHLMPCHTIACIVLMAVFVHLGGLQLAESVERGQICMAHTAMRKQGKKNGVNAKNTFFVGRMVFWRMGPGPLGGSSTRSRVVGALPTAHHCGRPPRNTQAPIAPMSKPERLTWLDARALMSQACMTSMISSKPPAPRTNEFRVRSRARTK